MSVSSYHSFASLLFMFHSWHKRKMLIRFAHYFTSYLEANKFPSKAILSVFISWLAHGVAGWWQASTCVTDGWPWPAWPAMTPSGGPPTTPFSGHPRGIPLSSCQVTCQHYSFLGLGWLVHILFFIYNQLIHYSWSSIFCFIYIHFTVYFLFTNH